MSHLIVALLAGSVTLWGADVSADSSASEVSLRNGNGKATAESPAEQERAVMEFLRRHHPELAELLNYLKTSRPKDHQRAIRELSRTCERLSELREQDDTEYELQLQSWVVQSRIHLIVARLSMAGGEDLRNELRRLLNEQVDVKLRMLQNEREKQMERLAKIDEHIESVTQNRDETVEKQFQSLTKDSQAGGPRLKPQRSKRP